MDSWADGKFLSVVIPDFCADLNLMRLYFILSFMLFTVCGHTIIQQKVE